MFIGDVKLIDKTNYKFLISLRLEKNQELRGKSLSIILNYQYPKFNFLSRTPKCLLIE